MSKLFNEYFGDMKEIYEETMSEINEELEAIAEFPDAECNEDDAPEYIEAAIGESHWKMLVMAMRKAVEMVGDSIFKAMSEEE